VVVGLVMNARKRHARSKNGSAITSCSLIRNHPMPRYKLHAFQLIFLQPPWVCGFRLFFPDDLSSMLFIVFYSFLMAEELL
jgi:hypothetical protein